MNNGIVRLIALFKKSDQTSLKYQRMKAILKKSINHILII